MDVRALVSGPRRPVLAVAALLLVVSLARAFDPLTGHDEGQLMFGFARGLSSDFWPIFFWQKSKPALALFYLPTARLGFGAFLALHALVSALAVVLVGEVAMATGQRRPWLPALIVAASPIFVWSTLTGVSNSDGVAVIALALYLLEARKAPLLAGLVFGLMPWVRYETAVFSALIGLVAFASRPSARLALGALAWPALYLGAGAVYHRSALWFVRFPPGVSDPSGIDAWMQGFASHSLASLVSTFALVSPTLGLLVLLRPPGLSAVERAMAAFVLLFFGLFAATHFAPVNLGPAMILGFSSRYALIALPAVALLAGRALEAAEDEAPGGRRGTAAALALAAAGAWLLRRGAGALAAWCASATAAAVAAAQGRVAALLAVPAVALALLGPLGLRDELASDYPVQFPQVTRALRQLREQGAAEVYTNSHVLALYADRTGLATPRVRFMLAADMSLELAQLTNEANGQRAAVAASIPRAVFGDVVLPSQLDPGLVPRGTWFALVSDSRTDMILPPARWSPLLREVGRVDEMRLLRLGP